VTGAVKGYQYVSLSAITPPGFDAEGPNLPTMPDGRPSRAIVVGLCLLRTATADSQRGAAQAIRSR
jgi:hypothetical protein